MLPYQVYKDSDLELLLQFGDLNIIYFCFRLLWSMRSVTANLFGVARSSANSAKEENSITPATEINMLSVSK